MLTDGVLLFITISLVIVVGIMEWVGDSSIVERHHSHHDTYVISSSMSHVLALAIFFMGLFGATLGWLCMVGVFPADETVVLAFFTAFVVVTFAMWFCMRRYLVCTYKDHMEVVPLLGPRRSIRYDEIDELRWSGAFTLVGDRSIAVVVNGKVVAMLLGTLDLDQILLSIDREDALMARP